MCIIAFLKLVIFSNFKTRFSCVCHRRPNWQRLEFVDDTDDTILPASEGLKPAFNPSPVIARTTLVGGGEGYCILAHLISQQLLSYFVVYTNSQLLPIPIPYRLSQNHSRLLITARLPDSKACNLSNPPSNSQANQSNNTTKSLA